jgi:predicted permease
MPDATSSVKLYRCLLNLYPAAFRENYGVEMEREFRDELAESHGFCALAILWVRLLADLSKSVPLQVALEVRQDARHTFRLWANRPWQTGFAILALAIGIGANTGVFSVVNALLVRSLPFRDPSRLASLQAFQPPHDSAKQLHDWLRQSTYLADAGIFEQADMNLGSAQGMLRAHVAQASSNFFSLLGTRVALGRGFSPDEDTPGHNAVAVIGYGLWQQLFAGDVRAIGSIIRIQGMPLTVIGVAPAEFDFPNHTVLWKGAQFATGNNGWETIARLKPGMGWPEARAAFAADVDRFWPIRHKGLKNPPKLISLQDQLAGPVKNASLMLMAAVVLILALACTNVVSVLLARAADRGVELSIRSALGASRARLVEQLLTEGLLLSFVACAAGVAVAFWTTSVAVEVEPAPLATQSYSVLDWRVLLFAAAIATLTGLLFGILPSWDAGRIHSFGARPISGTRRSRLFRESLVAAQVMLTIVLLTASVSVGRAFIKLMRMDRGFETKGLVTVSVSLDGTTHELTNRQLPYFEEALARIRRLPGVRSASATEYLPLYATSFVGGPFRLDGRPASTNSLAIPVLPDYFKAMGGHILYGREFSEAEVRSDAKVAVVNEFFAREFGAPADALGHQVTLGKEGPWKIVGVVRGMNYMVDDVTSSQIFLPAHSPGGFSPTFVVRVDGRAEDHLPMIRDTIRTIDAQVPVFSARTMERRLDDAIARPKFYRTALQFFAGFALLLAVIGIYGIVSYAVAQRTREMGVRLSLGTTPVRLRRLLLGQGLLPVMAGAISGVAGAILAGRFLESLVDGAKPIDLATFTFSITFILGLAATSIWSATRRITKLDIMEILRVE